jgi:hypothetical protein
MQRVKAALVGEVSSGHRLALSSGDRSRRGDPESQTANIFRDDSGNRT